MKHIYILSIVLLSSCSFNKLFLIPDKIPQQAKEGKAIDSKGNPIKVKIKGENYQPLFYSTEDKLLELTYKVESFVFRNEVDNKLNAWLISPKENDKNTTLFVLHGNAGNLFSQYGIYLKLVEKGYRVAILDYSGFGFSEGKATRKITLDDANSFIMFFENNPLIKNSNKILYGQSYGGHLAAVIGNQNQEKFDAVIIDAAFSSPKDISAEFSGLGFIARIFTKTIFSASDNIHEIKKPILIIHSTSDETIPYEMGQKLYEKATDPKQFITTSGCHTCAPITNTDEIVQFILEL